MSERFAKDHRTNAGPLEIGAGGGSGFAFINALSAWDGRDRIVERLGVEPQRVEFVAYQLRNLYFLTYRRIDIGLDTLPYNGHTTSLDSFWMGVPVVTRMGETIVGGGLEPVE